MYIQTYAVVSIDVLCLPKDTNNNNNNKGKPMLVNFCYGVSNAQSKCTHTYMHTYKHQDMLTNKTQKYCLVQEIKSIECGYVFDTLKPFYATERNHTHVTYIYTYWLAHTFRRFTAIFLDNSIARTHSLSLFSIFQTLFLNNVILCYTVDSKSLSTAIYFSNLRNFKQQFVQSPPNTFFFGICFKKRY